MRSAYTVPQAQETFAASVQKTRDLAVELDLMNPVALLLWKQLFDRRLGDRQSPATV